mgnify:CR=1 FL=1
MALTLAVGLALSLACGGRLARLKTMSFRGETFLLLLLVPQMLLPALRLQGVSASAAHWLWLSTFPLLIGLCLMNASHRPLLLVAAGLALNGIVIALNGGMPVSPQAVAAVAGGARLLISTGDFAHVVMSSSTRLALLADVLPLPGPSVLRGRRRLAGRRRAPPLWGCFGVPASPGPGPGSPTPSC